MQKQKKGFLLFISSLIPGAGEMYMGFFKQGISIMTLFWAIIAIAGGLNISSLVIFLPVLWFYSFFHVHNLKELPEEEFYAIEDNYILHLDRIFQNNIQFSQKHIKIAASLLIVFGVAVFWNGFPGSALLDFTKFSGYYYTGYHVPDSFCYHWNSDHHFRLSASYRKNQKHLS